MKGKTKKNMLFSRTLNQKKHGSNQWFKPIVFFQSTLNKPNLTQSNLTQRNLTQPNLTQTNLTYPHPT